MARYRVEGERSRELIDDSAVDADLYKILGIEDPGNLDVEKLWAPTLSGPPYEDNPWGSKWLQIPIGVDSSGAPVVLDFKESNLGGMGNHMVIAGTTGSGKSSFDDIDLVGRADPFPRDAGVRVLRLQGQDDSQCGRRAAECRCGHGQPEG